MPKRGTLALAVIAMAMAFQPAQSEEQQMASTQQNGESGYVEVNGLSYHYEIQGEGEPLLLLHGGFGTSDMFTPIMPQLARSRQVIGVDLHGHGRTALGERPLDLADMGRDMGLLVQALGHERVDVMGYSMGGGVAAQMAVQHPHLVGRLVLLSTPAGKDGFYPEIAEQMQQIGAHMEGFMRDTPMYEAYAAVAPRVEDFPRLLEAMGEMMRRPDLYEFEVEALGMPVMLVFGDGDMFRLEHIVAFYKRLGGGQGDAGWARENMARNRLAILPDLTHYETFMAPEMVRTVLPFLNGESNAPAWTAREQAAE